MAVFARSRPGEHLAHVRPAGRRAVTGGEVERVHLRRLPRHAGVRPAPPPGGRPSRPRRSPRSARTRPRAGGAGARAASRGTPPPGRRRRRIHPCVSPSGRYARPAGTRRRRSGASRPRPAARGAAARRPPPPGGEAGSGATRRSSPDSAIRSPGASRVTRRPCASHRKTRWLPPLTRMAAWSIAVSRRPSRSTPANFPSGPSTALRPLISTRRRSSGRASSRWDQWRSVEREIAVVALGGGRLEGEVVGRVHRRLRRAPTASSRGAPVGLAGDGDEAAVPEERPAADDAVSRGVGPEHAHLADRLRDQQRVAVVVEAPLGPVGEAHPRRSPRG